MMTIGFLATALASGQAFAVCDEEKPERPDFGDTGASAEELGQMFRNMQMYKVQMGHYRTCISNATLPGGPDEAQALIQESKEEEREVQAEFRQLAADARKNAAG
jgi:hypothetical protein